MRQPRVWIGPTRRSRAGLAEESRIPRQGSGGLYTQEPARQVARGGPCRRPRDAGGVRFRHLAAEYTKPRPTRLVRIGAARCRGGAGTRRDVDRGGMALSRGSVRSRPPIPPGVRPRHPHAIVQQPDRLHRTRRLKRPHAVQHMPAPLERRQHISAKPGLHGQAPIPVMRPIRGLAHLAVRPAGLLDSGLRVSCVQVQVVERPTR